MAGVAARAGVSTATLYRRWPSKEDLVVGSLEHSAEESRPAVPDTGSLAGDLTVVLQDMADRLNGEGGQLLEGMLSETVRNKELAETLRRRLTVPRHTELGTILDRAAARHEIHPVDDSSVAMSLITGPLYERLLITGEPLTPDVVAAIVRLLVRALGASAGAAPG
jgi:AcrR family transcriptional regulator